MGCVEELWGKRKPRGSSGKSENPESNETGTGRTISFIYHSWIMTKGSLSSFQLSYSTLFFFLQSSLMLLSPANSLSSILSFLCRSSLYIYLISVQIILISMTILSHRVAAALMIHLLYSLMAFSNALQQSTFHAVVY